jgi:hypothetical protein
MRMCCHSFNAHDGAATRWRSGGKAPNTASPLATKKQYGRPTFLWRVIFAVNSSYGKLHHHQPIPALVDGKWRIQRREIIHRTSTRARKSFQRKILHIIPEINLIIRQSTTIYKRQDRQPKKRRKKGQLCSSSTQRAGMAAARAPQGGVSNHTTTKQQHPSPTNINSRQGHIMAKDPDNNANHGQGQSAHPRVPTAQHRLVEIFVRNTRAVEHTCRMVIFPEIARCHRPLPPSLHSCPQHEASHCGIVAIVKDSVGAWCSRINISGSQRAHSPR